MLVNSWIPSVSGQVAKLPSSKIPQVFNCLMQTKGRHEWGTPVGYL